ncbi:MFS transporter [Cellulomonas marina]|uniref:Predicted arabinose efflux permease, MFS family n=1 Tax=Cellulomonas marina TaxID=988821 RepID=A0A1I0XYN4_9CELL|nr:MFS transporter [Cellulomonas marina]SFB05787.1 Predicted arabinose efflux permease, MFS family [Cellulomonas marina]
MLQPYRDVLARPGAPAFVTAGTLARLPMSTVGIGIVLAVSQLTGSYALAGRVSGVFVALQALCAPQLARLVDRHGQGRVMRPAMLLSALGLVGVGVGAVAGWAEAWLYLAAAVGGAAIGSFSSLSRARWSTLLRRDPTRLHSAYALESVLDEVVFVVGPVLATFLATAVHPTAGLVVGTVSLLVGGWAFLQQRSTEPAPAPRGHDEARRRTVLRTPAVAVVTAVFVAMGAIFGAVDVAAVAFAEEAGTPWAAGVVLALFAVGSLLAGLVYGTRHWTRPVGQRFATGMVALGLAVCLFALVGSLPVLGVVLFVAGLAIAPTLINGNTLVQAAVPPEQLTEGLSWIGTALGAGVALGSALAGARIDAAGAHAGFHVVVAAGVLSVLAAVAAGPVLRRAALVG